MVMPTQAKPTDRLFYWSRFSASDIYRTTTTFTLSP